MKYKRYGIVCILLFLLVACTAKEHKLEKEQIKEEKEEKEEIAKKEEIKEEQDEKKDKRIGETLALGYHLQKPVILAKEVLTYHEIELPEKIDDKEMAVVGIYDENRFFVTLKNIAALEEQEYGLFDTKSQSYQSLLLPPGKGKMLAGIIAHNEDYVAYMEYHGKSEFDRTSDEDEPLTIFLKIYDMKQKKTMLVHAYSEFYPYSSLHFKNEIILKEDKLYFDDFNEDGTDANLYCYDAKSQKAEIIKTAYQNPGLYQGGIVVIGRSGTEQYDTIYQLSGEKVVSLPENIIELSTSERSIFGLDNKNTDEKLRITTFSLNDLLSGEELLETQITISQPESNRYYLCWRNYTDQVAVLYSIEKNSFLVFDDLPRRLYRFELQGSGGLIISYGEGGTKYYRFAEK